MSYLRALYKTYEENEAQVGEIFSKETKDKKVLEYTLLPISHTTQTAHIEMIINLEGTLYDAKVIEKINTILPFTESSGSRSGKNYVSHMLQDKLMYVAGDYVAFTQEEDKKDAHLYYLEQLGEWCNSPYSHPHVQAIYEYVKKGTLIQDLVECSILHLTDAGLLRSKWDTKQDGDKPPIFQMLAGAQESAFVRFNVHVPGDVIDPVWSNKDIYNAYSQFYNTKLQESDICYVTGEYLPFTVRHPNKLRNSGDKAKLISANDGTGFTYRGRFKDSFEAANISYDVSQKAHNALKWLIERQGKHVDGRIFLVWGSKNPDMPYVADDLSSDVFKGLNFFLEQRDAMLLQKADTKKVLADQHSQIISGIKKNMDIQEHDDEKVYILTLDAATPGRLAVLYYRDLDIKEYFAKLLIWHEDCSWRHTRKKNDEWVQYFGSPSFYTIAHAAYGPRPSDKIVKSVMERMLPCILDGRKIPIDIVRSSITRASNPQFYNQAWEWEQVLGVACSLAKKHYYDKEEEVYTVALDTTNPERDYLFGRLLAVADVLERNALGKEENRPTNALRYMNAFSRHPARTWSTIQRNLQPYQMKLRDKGIYYTKLIDEIGAQMNINDFTDVPLTGKYLLGYYSQRQALYTKKEKNEEES
ncbi:type I-C CRISPR-associated protein Cas8c/Csd1 [Lysinibacillus sp. G4S2]|uniref:type I-C CRISPR-associated protein Cas8c/Csd1 n=1 Tax=Lysinibacillus sp. G4S2 TaxID=3055859 RepID=UPI0025A1FA96|nr:type I-C CRISPR-associated protein Cas8c/Csd1 [Lysinibacillus sp. G4S2]MDM5248047.1 type I-C CRISPR-associated protein Cas8c/Csd1 [Lysinibacillus sp. G4S2]